MTVEKWVGGGGMLVGVLKNRGGMLCYWRNLRTFAARYMYNNVYEEVRFGLASKSR